MLKIILTMMPYCIVELYKEISMMMLMFTLVLKMLLTLMYMLMFTLMLKMLLTLMMMLMLRGRAVECLVSQPAGLERQTGRVDRDWAVHYFYNQPPTPNCNPSLHNNFFYYFFITSHCTNLLCRVL